MNTCYYSAGNKHDCCTHQHYCIFNPKRTELSERITKVQSQLEFWKNVLSNLLVGDCYVDKGYKEVKKKIDVLELDLKQLRLFELKVINGDIDGYGFLES